MCVGSFMKQVFMAEQLHTSRRSLCAMPGISWSAAKHAATGLWSSGKRRVGHTLLSGSLTGKTRALQNARSRSTRIYSAISEEVWQKMNNSLGLFFRVCVRAFNYSKKVILTLQHTKTFLGIVCSKLFGNSLRKGIFCSSITMPMRTQCSP